jgi:hypothetical protein
MKLSMTEKSVDTDARADKAWLLNVQRKLYQWRKSGWMRQPDYAMISGERGA